MIGRTVFFSSLAILWTALGAYAFDKTERSAARGYRCKYTVTLEAKAGVSIDPAKDWLFWWAAPKEWATQRVVQVESVTPPADSTYIDPQNGNLIYHWDFSQHDRKGFEALFSFRALPDLRRYDAGKVLPLDPQDEIQQNYLQGDPWNPLSDDLIRAARELVQGKTNPIEKARAIYDHSVEIGDPRAFKLCAMCRAVGIPSRRVFGFDLEKENVLLEWAEVFIPPYHWIPLELHSLEFNSVELLLGPHSGFGRLGANRYIVSKGSNVELRPDPAWEEFEAYSPPTLPLVQGGRAAFLGPSVWNFKKIKATQADFRVISRTDPSFKRH